MLVVVSDRAQSARWRSSRGWAEGPRKGLNRPVSEKLHMSHRLTYWFFSIFLHSKADYVESTGEYRTGQPSVGSGRSIRPRRGRLFIGYLTVAFGEAAGVTALSVTRVSAR